MKLNVSTLIVVVVLVVSLAVNAWLINERLETKYYESGRREGATKLSNQIVNQVVKSGQLTVTLPNGTKVLLTAAHKQPVSVIPIDPNGQ